MIVDIHTLGIIAFLCFSDIMLTMHVALLFKSKGAWHQSMELNWLPRLIIGDNPSYLKGLLSFPVFFGIYYGMLWISSKFAPTINLQFLSGIWVGALVIVNYLHLQNLRHFYETQDDKEYWADRKKHAQRMP